MEIGLDKGRSRPFIDVANRGGLEVAVVLVRQLDPAVPWIDLTRAASVPQEVTQSVIHE